MHVGAGVGVAIIVGSETSSAEVNAQCPVGENAIAQDGIVECSGTHAYPAINRLGKRKTIAGVRHGASDQIVGAAAFHVNPVIHITQTGYAIRLGAHRVALDRGLGGPAVQVDAAGGVT